jgi:hypothetical protein
VNDTDVAGLEEITLYNPPPGTITNQFKQSKTWGVFHILEKPHLISLLNI